MEVIIALLLLIGGLIISGLFFLAICIIEYLKYRINGMDDDERV